jgi:formylglycine-generating enzyme required for sulfatase activity
VLHYNDKRLPEQRAELYDSIVTWLLRAREKKPGRLGDDLSRRLYQRLAYTMQTRPGGRTRSIDIADAENAIKQMMPPKDESSKRTAAALFIENEEMDSGIIVKRGNSVEFWHLTFQEYLAACELAGGIKEEEFREVLEDHGKEVLLLPEWRETLLLLSGVFYTHGIGRANFYFSFILQQLEKQVEKENEPQRLALQARYFSLMGAMVQDLSAYQFTPQDDRYLKLRDAVTAIFDKDKAARIEPAIRSSAADALGLAGDDRIHVDLRDCVINQKIREKMMVLIPEGEFLMGAQKKDKKKANYDEMAYDDEVPVHKVKLSRFWIAKYPVTVGQYELFVRDGGYKIKELWKVGGFGRFLEPGLWDRQKEYSTRPVVDVHWFEAAAFCRWVASNLDGVDLPTEAQWERAARGQYNEYCRYPWKGDEIDKNSGNWEKSEIGHASPVGIFPAGATEEGIFDIVGNVWEWCRDCFQIYSEEENVGSVKLLQFGSRIVRGGSWNSGIPYHLRCSFRNTLDRGVRLTRAGFRFVLSGI